MLISMEPVRRLGVYGRTRERAVGLAGWVRSRGSREGITRRWGENCGIFSAAPTSLLEAEVHGDGDEISAIAFDGFDLDARGCGPGQRQERDQRRQDPGARHRDRALLVLPAALVRIEIIIGWERPVFPHSCVCFQSDGRATMADLASAKKTLDGLVKAYAAGDATKTASLLGTLKVRV